jgi:uncharacterized protein (TIGR02145 family)
LTVYNTVTAGSGATAVVPGIYYYDGSQWALAAKVGGAPVITTQPKSFSWSRLIDASADPNGPSSATVANLTVAATGDNLKYQWYQKAATANTPDIIATGTGNATATYTPVVTAWGMKSYYCVVSNAYGSITSSVADVAIGCGAKTASGGWLKFMCHNLGAAPVGNGVSLDNITFGSGTTATDTLSSDAKGWWFQWGRKADGHQWRGSTAIAGPDTTTTYDGTASAKRAGLFITNSNGYTAWDWHWPQYDFFWRNWNDNRFPCPGGWRVPASDEWGSLFVDGGTYGPPAIATANAWYWENKGVGLRPDGSTTTLFLPAAGRRYEQDGVVSYVGTLGNYWSCTAASSGALHLDFGSASVAPAISNYRARGNSVRCVAEN